jgi:hypothetical protein
MATTPKKVKTKAEIEQELRDVKRELKRVEDENKKLVAANINVAPMTPTVEPQMAPQQPIDWDNRMVEIMQLMPGETTLYFGSGENRMEVGRLNGSGTIISLSFSELRRVINTPPFSRYFEEFGIIILDNEAIKKLNRTRDYAEYNIGANLIDQLFDLKADALEKKLAAISKRSLQFAVVYQCMININKGDPRCTKPQVHEVFNRVFKLSRGSDIYTLAQRLKSTV